MEKNMSELDLFMYQSIFGYCKENPNFVPGAIDAATEGVKAFAKDQTDKSSAMAARLIDILWANRKIKTMCFNKAEILESISKWYGGTEAFKEVEKNLTVICKRNKED